MDIKSKRKVRDYAIKGGICLVFAVVLYLGLSSSSGEDGKEPPATGLNTELPDAKTGKLLDKKEAYESERLFDREEQRVKSLDDYMFDLKSKRPDISPENPGTGTMMTSLPQAGGNAGMEALRKSISSHTGTDEIDREYERVQSENERLRREIRELGGQSRSRRDKEEQVALMEKSYELAAKYGGKGDAPEKAIPVEEKRETVEVRKKDGELVSTLSEELLEDAPYNFGFITAAGSGYSAGANTIRACVAEEQTVTAGQRVMLRLLEPLQAGSMVIPRNHLIAGTTRIQGDRMNILIENIEFAGNIIPVEMKVYDTDGMPGIYCPGSVELDALKEGAANIGSGLGSSISFTQSAGQQIAMDLTRGVMNGASQYVSKKMRTVKVTLRSDYEVLLLPKNN